MKNFGIYIIKNKENGRVYIGSTVRSFRDRKREHFKKLVQNAHYNKYLQEEFNVFGRNSFIFEILESVDDKNIVRKVEQEWIDIFNPFYNIDNTVRELSKVTFDSRKAVSSSRGGRAFEIYKNDILLETFDFIIDAVKKYKLNSSGISGCLSGKFSQHKGYKFKYVGENFKFIQKERKAWNKGKKTPKHIVEKSVRNRKNRTPWNKGKKTGSNWTTESSDKHKRTMLKNGTSSGKPAKRILAEKNGVSVTFFSMSDFAKFVKCSVSHISRKHKNTLTSNIKGYKTTIIT